MNLSKYTKKIYTLISSIIIASTMLTACSSSQNVESDTINIATKPMSEQFILAEMLKIIIEDNTNLNVKITKGIGGGTSNIHPAILNGEFDMYPEYTGTGWSFVLKEKNIPSDDKLFTHLSKQYEDEYDLKWVGLYGFNNTFGLAIRKDIADKYNIKTYSDLSKYSSDLIFGAEYDFYERDDGYDSLCESYGFNFKDSIDLDIGLKYNSINSNKIDVMNVFTTDGQISKSNVILLDDDKNFYQTYYCSTVVRNDVLDKYPQLESILMKMDNLITSSEMAKLNYLLESENQLEEKIARDFLIEKGLIK